jgi:ubiquinone/menaquinone biosynthesis C-methylase UbiE
LTRPTGWLSYDSVADTYEQTAVAWFEPMARDLIAAVQLSPGERVLDVGTGTGLTANLASIALGRAGCVIGIDPSMGMLRIARQRSLLAVAAMTPGLPFPPGCFDAVVANLVLSHLPDLDRGLADMLRVVHPGGRLGVTAWGPDTTDPDDQGSEADTVVASAREICALSSETPVKGAPWEQQLRSSAQLSEALTRAGLTDVNAQLRTYRHRFSIDDYLSGWGGLGRYLRSQAGHQRWNDFCEFANATLRERFADGIVSIKQLWIATAVAR